MDLPKRRKQRIAEDERDLRHDCDRILQNVDSVIGKIRRLAHDLSQSVVEELGLASALKYLLDDFCLLYGVKCSTVGIDEVDQLFPQDQKINIYRTFQEALTNIGKHAEASCVSLLVAKERSTVRFSLEDNGRGFQMGPQAAPGPRRMGLGLAAITERVKLLGGTLRIESQPGAGTKISFSLPLGSKA